METTLLNTTFDYWEEEYKPGLIMLYVLPIFSILSECLLTLGFFILCYGIRWNYFEDPIYRIWLFYTFSTLVEGFVDVSMYISDWKIEFPSPFHKKWAAWLDYSFGWVPAVLLEFALSLYYFVIVRFPIRYHHAKRSGRLQRYANAIIIVVMFASIFMGIPLTIPGFEVNYWENIQKSSGYSPQMTILIDFFFVRDVSLFACTFATYAMTCCTIYTVIGTSRTSNRQRNLILTAFITTCFTCVHSIFYYSERFTGTLKSETSQYAMELLTNISLIASYASNPIVQFCRNSQYRRVVLLMLCRKRTTTPAQLQQVSMEQAGVQTKFI